MYGKYGRWQKKMPQQIGAFFDEIKPSLS